MIVAAIVSLLLVAIGVALVGAGAMMSLYEWATAENGVIKARRAYLGDTLAGLSKLVEALNHYPTGQRLVAFGVAVLIIAGVLGGFSGLEANMSRIALN